MGEAGWGKLRSLSGNASRSQMQLNDSSVALPMCSSLMRLDPPKQMNCSVRIELQLLMRPVFDRREAALGFTYRGDSVFTILHEY